jgi:hypothetical protein
MIEYNSERETKMDLEMDLEPLNDTEVSQAAQVDHSWLFNDNICLYEVK